MAKLKATPYPFPKISDYKGDWKKYDEESEKALEEIPYERIYSYPVGDGNAIYYIESFSPPILQHVPYSDCWQVSPAHIKGLKEQDLRKHVEVRKLFRSLFGGKNA